MQTERVTDKEAIFLFIAFVIGSTLIIGVGGSAKNDAWISVIIGFIMSLPMLFIYARLSSLYHGKDLFDILKLTLGEVLGRVVSVVYILYIFHLGSLVLHSFGEFTNTVAMPETPMFVQIFALGCVCIIAARLGIEVMGRVTTYIMPVVFVILVVVQLMAIPQLHPNFLKPVFSSGLKALLKAGFSAFAFPFTQTLILMGAIGTMANRKSPKKVFLIGTAIPAVIILFITLRNIMVLGSMGDAFYFPSYEAVSRITIGSYIERIEVTVSIVFVFGAFMKASICLLAACKGIEKVFNLQNYRSVVIEAGLLMIYLAYIIYDDIMTMQVWAFQVYPYYSFPMKVILPVIVWIVAEIKCRRRTRQEKKAQEELAQP